MNRDSEIRTFIGSVESRAVEGEEGKITIAGKPIVFNASTDIGGWFKFNNDKADYSSASLKPMLDFVLTTKLANDMDNQTYKVVKQQIEFIKTNLDLSVHNLKYFADIESNKKAWSDLEPLFVYLSNNINKAE